MKRKASIIAVAAVLSAAMSVPAFAAETEGLVENKEIISETEGLQENVETVTETDVETEADVDFRKAFLSDADYEAGMLNENGWFSRFLNLQYIPNSDDVFMSADLNDTLQGYYSRNGEENMVASSEFVATMDINNMIQVTTETNPDQEKAEDILNSFIDVDVLEETDKPKEMEFAGMKFLVVEGKSDDRDCFMAVSTQKEGIVIEMRCVFDSEENRDAMLAGFAVFSEEDMKQAGVAENAEETETAAARDHASDNK